MNISTLTGDNPASHFGMNVGFLTNTKLGEKSRAGLELLYSQNGEYILPDYYPNVPYNKALLEFLEIPLYFQYAVLKKEDYYKLKLQGGIAYTCLLYTSPSPRDS